MVRTSDPDKAHVGAGEHVGQMLGSVRDRRQSLFGPSADRVHDHVEYSLTEVGERLRPIIEAMKTWGGTITETNTSPDFSSHWRRRELLSLTAAWETKRPEPFGSGLSSWCERGELNPHEHTLTAT